MIKLMVVAENAADLQKQMLDFGETFSLQTRPAMAAHPGAPVETEVPQIEANVHPGGKKKPPKKPKKPKNATETEPTSSASALGLAPEPAAATNADNGVTLDNVRDQMQILMTKRDMPTLQLLMKQFDVAKASDLDPAQYPGVIRAIEELLAS